MKPRTWKFVAITICGGAALACFGLSGYVGYLMFQITNPVLAFFTAGFVLEGLFRRLMHLWACFWPEEARSDWIEQNPPLFRFDRLRDSDEHSKNH